jgi:hypothetical protein
MNEVSVFSSKFQTFKQNILDEINSENIKCILAYGSRIENVEFVDEYSDYDITLVLKSNPDNPITNCINKSLDLTIIVWDDIFKFGIDFFHLDSHGVFFLHKLANAKTLWGNNEFPDILHLISQESLESSIKKQIFLHCWKLQNLLILNRPSNHRNIIKYSFRIAQNAFFYENGIDYKTFNGKAYNEWIKIFKTSKLLNGFSLKYLLRLCNQHVSIQDTFKYLDIVRKNIAIQKDGTV